MDSETSPPDGTYRSDTYTWSKQTVLRIEALSEQQVLSELQGVIEGRTYSWHSISKLLQSRLDEGDLEFVPADGNILFEWNNLCYEKQEWERKGRLSQECAEFNRDCLINLMILPFQAGLGFESLQLITTNVDKLNLSTTDLWVGYEWQELGSTDNDSENIEDDENLSWVVEDNESSDRDEGTKYDESQNSDIDAEYNEYDDFEDDVDEEYNSEYSESEGY
ncbi:hypothetical protein BGZ60DRAFT_404018 [Tricladium varicosporioides]|nr:hypothetical protein BGZ60DRAFT_404018 [Hymenoscyphus varicosporioides]